MSNILTKLDFTCPQSLVIGDIHGRYDLLCKALELVETLSEKLPTNLILLGDYIDRGGNSKLVMEKLWQLFNNNPNQSNKVALMGNHEQMCIYAHNFSLFEEWIENGGDSTLESYNADTLPAHDIKFMSSMPIVAEDKNAIYVHAGINPNHFYDSDKQYPQCLWIRDEFFQNVAKLNYPKPIIYGHTTRTKPEIHRDEFEVIVAVGIDTGAEFSDHLTLLQIISEDEAGLDQFMTSWTLTPRDTYPSAYFR